MNSKKKEHAGAFGFERVYIFQIYCFLVETNSTGKLESKVKNKKNDLARVSLFLLEVLR